MTLAEIMNEFDEATKDHEDGCVCDVCSAYIVLLDIVVAWAKKQNGESE